MRIIGLMVVGNEAERFLEPCLQWLTPMVDDLLVYDDQSEDASMEIAASTGAVVVRRDDSIPAFLTDESEFRGAAWTHVETRLKPTRSDWVLAIDADEFVVSVQGDAAGALHAAIDAAESESCSSVELPVAEVFGVHDHRLQIRTDGQWDKIRATCLGQWRPGLGFPRKKLGCGRLPVMPGPALRYGDPCIVHAGYLRPQDRPVKRLRYSRAGHGGSHVKSITEVGKLAPWMPSVPPEVLSALEERA